MWDPVAWAEVWRALVAKAPSVEAGEAPAWHAWLQRWQPAEVLAAIRQLPARPSTPFWQLLDILDPPPPSTEQAFAEAVQLAAEAVAVHEPQSDSGPQQTPRRHTVVLNAAARVGYPWLREVAPADRARALRRWAEVYDAAARQHEQQRLRLG